MTQESRHRHQAARQVFPLCYFPPVQWYAAWKQSLSPVAEAWSWYQKQQLTSRTWIKGPSGPLALHIPVERRSKKAPIIEKKVSFQENWPQTHWRSLKNYYRNSPYFTFYEDQFETYFSQRHEYLLDWLTASTELAFSCLGWPQTVTITSGYAQPEGDDDDFRGEFSGKLGVSSIFNPIAYTQVYGDFSPGLSIMDLIFSNGPEAILHLNREMLGNRQV